MSGTIRIEVAGVLNLPVEIVGFDINGATFLAVERRWLQPESAALLTEDADKVVLKAFDPTQTPVIRFAHFDIPLLEIHRRDNEIDFMQELDVQVATRISGLSATHWTPAQPGYPEVLIIGEGR
jgi:hypothetical protein